MKKYLFLFIPIFCVSCKTLQPSKFNFTGASLDKSAIVVLDKDGSATVYKKMLENDKYCYKSRPVKISGEYYCSYECKYAIDCPNDNCYVSFFDDYGDYPFKGWGHAKVKYTWRWYIHSIEIQNGYGIVDNTNFYKFKITE